MTAEKPAASRARKKSARPRKPVSRLFDARPDTADFRDRVFEPRLHNIPTQMPLQRFLRVKTPVLDQHGDGACTAFGLATVVHALLRMRTPDPANVRPDRVSTRMLYDMARRYDEWQGEAYAGSSCRGAMKGWHRHGVCSEKLWPYRSGDALEIYNETRARDALKRPLGAYYRVNHKDLVAIHAAIAEAGVLYGASAVHEDWMRPDAQGHVPWRDQEVVGYHAFAIVGYDLEGLWIQNSWGTGWGKGGFGRIDYDEWLQRSSDVWVARLAVPVQLTRAEAVAVSNSSLAPQSTGYAQAELRPHIVSIDNDGRLRNSGRFAANADEIRQLIRNDLPRLTEKWKKKRILLYAHGGLTSEQTAVQRVADYRRAMLRHEIYPLCFMWKSDFWSTLGNVLREAARPRTEGIFDRAKDLLLDRLDDTLEPLARTLGGRTLWNEMKENAVLATTAVARSGDGQVIEAGGAAQVARLLHEWMQRDPSVELHLAGHSAGSIMMAPLLQLLTGTGQITQGPARGLIGMGAKVASVNLWAPSITVEQFLQTYAPALESRVLDRACLFTLTDKAENDDSCARIYNKSLLYLVAHAFEAQPRSWLDRRYRHGTPLVGMARFIEGDYAPEKLRKLIRDDRLDWVRSPSTEQPAGSLDAAKATTHGGFDEDAATLQATIARILGHKRAQAAVDIHRTDAGFEARRERLQDALELDR